MPPLISAELLPDRFWARVDKSGGPFACWPWTRGKTGVGYGSIGWKNAPHSLAHIVAFVLTNGELPAGHECVMHTCDNRACCNPAHLLSGTKASNSADMAAKGRSTLGARNPSSRLTVESVLQIRASVVAGESYRSIASRFGTTSCNVSLIANRQTWRHV